MDTTSATQLQSTLFGMKAARREEEEAGESYANTLLLQAQTLYKTTNLVVMLRGLNTPVILELIPGQQQVDYRMDIQVLKKRATCQETGYI